MTDKIPGQCANCICVHPPCYGIGYERYHQQLIDLKAKRDGDDSNLSLAEMGNYLRLCDWEDGLDIN